MKFEFAFRLLPAAITLAALGCSSAPVEDEEGSDEGAAVIRAPREEWTIKCTNATTAGVTRTPFATEPTAKQIEDACPNGIPTVRSPREEWVIKCEVDRSADGKAKRTLKTTEPTFADMKAACPNDFRSVPCTDKQTVVFAWELAREAQAIRAGTLSASAATKCPGDAILFCKSGAVEAVSRAAYDEASWTFCEQW